MQWLRFLYWNEHSWSTKKGLTVLIFWRLKSTDYDMGRGKKLLDFKFNLMLESMGIVNALDMCEKTNENQ